MPADAPRLIAWSVYQISPILWNKVRRRPSAGRVQSVARCAWSSNGSRNLDAFTAEEYWTVGAEVEGQDGHRVYLRLTKIDGQKAGWL